MPIVVGCSAALAGAGPVLIEDHRSISAFAHATDAGGAGVVSGPNVTTLGVPGGGFGGLEAANSFGGNFDAVAAAGTKQFSFFEGAGFTRFSADAIAEVVADRRSLTDTANAISETSIRLVLFLDADTPFEIAGELRAFEIGGGSTSVLVSLRAVDASGAVFERHDVGTFQGSGTLEKGTWVFELLARASASSDPMDAESLNAQAIFRDVRLSLAPSPTSTAPLAGAVLILARRRRH